MSFKKYMKALYVIPVFALAFLALQPGETHALSCMSGEMMIEYYVNDDQYQIVTATPVAEEEYIKEVATEKWMQDSGYTGQMIEVTEAHKGYADSQQWVYYRTDATWGYLCAGEPPALNTEALYIIDSTNELPTVVNSYPVDSELAADILAALEASDDLGEPSINEVTAQNWRERIASDIRDLAFLIKVKFGEWKFWRDL